MWPLFGHISQTIEIKLTKPLNTPELPPSLSNYVHRISLLRKTMSFASLSFLTSPCCPLWKENRVLHPSLENNFRCSYYRITFQFSNISLFFRAFFIKRLCFPIQAFASFNSWHHLGYPKRIIPCDDLRDRFPRRKS
jgi:hypothetical protein